MANPVNLNYCKIIGNFKAFVADGADGDDLPDFVPMTGTGQIWPNVSLTKNTNILNKSTYFNSPISVSVDSDGDLAQGGNKYVMVLANSTDLNPATFNYSVILNLSAQGESAFRQYGPFAFDVTPGGTIDLTDAIPVASNAGTPIIQGPQGIQGIQGIQGPPNSLAIGTVSTLGASASATSTITGSSPNQTLNLGIPQGIQGIQGNPGDMVVVAGPANVSGAIDISAVTFPSTRLWTLTGNITSLTLPTPSASQSATFTLVMTQDATGSRTVTWPASVKWPDGISQQPAAAASNVSVFHLLWTGTTWLGLLGGKSFA